MRSLRSPSAHSRQKSLHLSTRVAPTSPRLRTSLYGEKGLSARYRSRYRLNQVAWLFLAAVVCIIVLRWLGGTSRIDHLEVYDHSERISTGIISVLTIVTSSDLERLRRQRAALASLSYPRSLLHTSTLIATSSAAVWIDALAHPPSTSRDQVFRHQGLSPDRAAAYLVTSALYSDADWVLWLDEGATEVPSDLVEVLMRTARETKADVVAAHCKARPEGSTASETYGHASHVRDDDESEEERKVHLDDLSSDETRLELHSVGRCATLVNADVHRQGVHFVGAQEGEAFVRGVRELGGRVVGTSEVVVWLD